MLISLTLNLRPPEPGPLTERTQPPLCPGWLAAIPQHQRVLPLGWGYGQATVPGSYMAAGI